MTSTFKAFVVNKNENQFTREIKELTLQDLPEGDVTIKVMYSSVNYKDGLASIPDGQIVRSYPFIPGIDAAGIVIDSHDEKFKAGDEVIVTSYGFGVSHYGGFSEVVRVPSSWVVPLPNGLTLKEAMVYGTAGLTAALSIEKLEHHGLTVNDGDVVVSGASGGVGSVAVAMLAKKGYSVIASTGKTSETEYLKNLGAKEVISREDLSPEKFSALGKARFAAAIDPVGGNTLAYILSSLKYGGAVASSGLTGGTSVKTSVFPFILRGVSLLGVDSVECPMSIRQPLWNKMAQELKPDALMDFIGSEITLDDLPRVLDQILKGEVKGRVIVKIGA
ncbi:MAG: acryloyl-CoA reductase [Erysipelotrichia bacterium]|jgi:putative YhdH/YhfP family quinone oxidoreductase|nr:acryloyl-CoA reductase [Erysipelotrichia bacterium]